MTNNVAFYTEQSQQAKQAIALTTKKFRVWVLLRLLIFLAATFGIYFAWGDWRMVALIFVLGLIVFLMAVSRFQDARMALNKAKKWQDLMQAEQMALKGDYSYFADGEEFKDTSHSYAHDMDLFGKNSIFQFLNRTFSRKGKLHLAQLLKGDSVATKEINEMIVALHENIDWCVKFRINGEVNDWGESLNADLEQLKKMQFSNPKWLEVSRFALTILGVLSFVALTIDWISGMAFSLVFLGNLLLVGFFLKSSNQAVAVIGQFDGKVNFLINQMELIQKLETKNPTLLAFIENLDREKGALLALQELLKIQRRFELRMNVLVGALLNGLFVWDFHQRTSLRKWLAVNQNKIGNWEADLVKLESYISGAFLKFNNSETIFASFTEQETMQVIGLRHPLIPVEKAVPNNVVLDEKHKMMILTGPNMAGKSTYLRSVGLLFVLANAGFPVFAQKAEIPKYHLYSSMRTSDDLSSESSYFHAELMRLKYILAAIERGDKIFILLDEILKGTNSLDKEQGSKQFLQKLKRLNVKGIIATHDLALCDLSNEKGYFFNGYFDSTILGDELFFDYLWREGVCKNMNASFLLKKMGLTD